MNLTLKILGISLLISSISHGAESCSQECNEPFGTLVGQSLLTKAYSNCSGYCVSNEVNEITLPKVDKPVFTGMKWQCVEYARRFWIENKGVTFGEVDYAYNIWDLPNVETVDTHQHLPLLKFENSVTKEAPKVGDLLINSVQMAITGHVSVIVGIEGNTVLIAEQNYFNRPWEKKTYARRLLMDKDSEGRYKIYDDSLLGWVRVGDKK